VFRVIVRVCPDAGVGWFGVLPGRWVMLAHLFAMNPSRPARFSVHPPLSATASAASALSSAASRASSPSAPPAALERLLSIEELSEYLGVPVKTLYDWRLSGKGPCAVHVGRQLRYFVADVHGWLTAQREARTGSGPAPSGPVDPSGSCASTVGR
jgi:excisionase family DNA binding protein